MSEEQEPEWLDDEEMDAWIQVATALARLPHALDAQLLRDAQLTHFEYEVLAALSEAPDRTLRMSVLAEMSYGSLSRLSHVVSRLEKRKWVRRYQCPEDGRFTNAVLTEAGWEKVVATAPGYVANVRRLVVDRLTRTQLRQVSAIGRRINNVEPDSR
ncbi:putative MarR family transcriptional regulator [Gordonia namibiensis NBRC 108229]|uniref:Putative MarR family transcriptional regulator n=1 Tax=Gordonia namibiensis NBRC 108229 TaxID=1208314 RepID=K6WGZ9_9ACTN|nr:MULTISPECIES: MarR family transcriptional regulator [Gordonia]MCK8615456.1 MarR family transcriptional regulator [Gordonia sp. C13]GAB98590.1 putative MarR family transcriptional regulator [Gordonia namibiensis NBRC 108229]